MTDNPCVPGTAEYDEWERQEAADPTTGAQPSSALPVTRPPVADPAMFCAEMRAGLAVLRPAGICKVSLA